MKIAGVVVLYNPGMDVAENVSLYINELDILYVVDNSDKKNMALIDKLKKNKKVSYLDNKGNKGIAHALNRGANLAIKQDYKWLLTMDQDSVVDVNMLVVMKKYIEENDSEMMGIIAPRIVKENERERVHKEQISLGSSKVLYKMDVITSGSLMNLEAFQIAGGFLNKLFIEFVDLEYCLRLIINNYKVIQINEAVLYQKYGDRLKLNGVELYNYSPIRFYYKVRNLLYVNSEYKKRFPEWCKRNKNSLISTRLIPAILYEDKKVKKIFYMVRGVIDYSLNKYGKI